MIWNDVVRMKLGLEPRSLREYLSIPLMNAHDKWFRKAREDGWYWSRGRPAGRIVGRLVFPRRTR